MTMTAPPRELCTDSRGHFYRTVDGTRSQCARCGQMASAAPAPSAEPPREPMIIATREHIRPRFDEWENEHAGIGTEADSKQARFGAFTGGYRRGLLDAAPAPSAEPPASVRMTLTKDADGLPRAVEAEPPAQSAPDAPLAPGAHCECCTMGRGAVAGCPKAPAQAAPDADARITTYLTGGGLFNPELANHDAVRDLLIDCRATIAQQARELAAARADAERWNALCNLWAHCTELALTQDEDGRWSIRMVEPVENITFETLTGDDPDAAIDQRLKNAAL